MGRGRNYDCDDDLDNDDNEVNYDDGSLDDGEDHVSRGRAEPEPKLCARIESLVFV